MLVMSQVTEEEEEEEEEEIYSKPARWVRSTPSTTARAAGVSWQAVTHQF